MSRRSLVHLLRSYGTGAEVILELVADRPPLGGAAGTRAPAHRRGDRRGGPGRDGDDRRRRPVAPYAARPPAAAARDRGGAAVAALMADELGWSPDEQAEQVRAYSTEAASLAVPG